MTARTANYDAQEREGVEIDYPMLAAEIIYKGTPVFTEANGRAFSNDGTTNTLSNGNYYVGIAAEKCDNSAGAAEAKFVKVLRKGVFLLPILGTVTQAKVGNAVYVNNVSDDSTATLTSDSGQPQARIGTLVKYVDSTHGWVQIDLHVDTIVAAA